MHFSEKDEEPLQENSSVDTVEADSPSENHKKLYGINDLLMNTASMLKKVVFVYKSTLELKDVLSKKNDIAKGAITQRDIQSIIKIISQDINNYIYKMHGITNQIRKSYLELENKINIILVSAEMDERYTSVFKKDFFYKTLNIYLERNIHEKVNSGVFLIKLDGLNDKSDIFIKNTYNTMLKKIYPELRYLDVVACISGDMFAVLIADVSRENFSFILQQIMKKIKSDTVKQIYSAGMIDQFDSNEILMRELESNLAKINHIKDDFIFV